MMYLTEKTLGEFLVNYFPHGQWIHDKTFIDKKRPDYRNDHYKMIVEFDGYLHYTQAKRILQDNEKDANAIKFGYNVIRIPYFVQLSPSMIKELFNLSIPEYQQIYPHGFIDTKACLPADFCELGIEKFKNDLVRFDASGISHDICISLANRVKSVTTFEYIYPKSLEGFLNTYIQTIV